MLSDYKAITEYNEDQLGKDTSSRKTQVSMYSDPTHFVYELLQNADDYGATEVLFKLSKDDIVIEHNGEPFKEENVKAITYIGKSTSREDLVKTGRFGIGFKSVFAFTATPIIISGTEHFQIYGLYRVKEYGYPKGFSRSRTCIILPFNHESEQPDFVEELMSREEAYRQISECLVGLDMNTLLFTRNIREIRWEIGDQSECYSREDYEVDHNTRLTAIKDGKHGNTYIVFSKIPTWEDKEHKPVEIAFAFDKQHQLSPINGEFLHVLFPTTQRAGLRFILNGPYRTNPARETISETDAFNLRLMKVTCELMREVLPKLRDGKLLILQFLSILPNEEDTLSEFYAPLRDTIIGEFRNQKLTPTKRGDHAPASALYRINTELSDLISDEDLAILLGKDGSLPFKVDEISQRRDARGRFVQDPNTQFIDNFLNTLQIPDWNMTEFVSTLLAQPEMIVGWLGKKTVEWHQTLYALLYDFLRLRQTGTYWYSSDSNLKNKLSDFPIIPCSDDIYRDGSKCFFPSDDVERDERFPRVLKGVYSSEGNDDQKSKARGFLEAINVRPVNEVVEIEAILNLRYVKGTIKLREPHYKRDLERFMVFLEEEPSKAVLFKKYHIFLSDDKWWGTPSTFYLDSSYYDTGLTACYKEFDEKSDIQKFSLSPKYETFSINPERFGKFAKAVGAQTELSIVHQRVSSDHPEYEDLVVKAPGQFRIDTHTSTDYTIDEFKILLNPPSVDKSKLIWQTMTDTLSAHHLEARYSKNQSQPDRVRSSSLVHKLKSAKWVPQKDGDSTSFVQPCDALIERLPTDFTYKTGQKWLEAIEFGKTANRQREESVQRDQRAKDLGFDSSEEARKYAELRQLLKDEEVNVDDVISQYKSSSSENKPNFPTVSVKNPELRKERVLEQVRNAPEKVYEGHDRRERVTKNEMDQRTPLREWYTNESDEMICQICKEKMPFKKTDDEYYFEAIEALTIRFKDDELPENHFPKEYEAQYLALCPECAARYNYFARQAEGSTKVMEELRNKLMNSENLEIPISLGELETSIRFVETHLHDLKAVLHYYENPQDSEESTD